MNPTIMQLLAQFLPGLLGGGAQPQGGGLLGGGLMPQQPPMTIPPGTTPPIVPPSPGTSAAQDWMSSPMFNMGLGLLASGGPSTTPNNPWSGILGGLQNSAQMRQQMQANQLRQTTAQAQLERYNRQNRKDDEAERLRTEKLEAVEKAIKDFPPELQAMARANPDAFLQQKAQQAFPTSTGAGPTVKEFYEGGVAVQKEWDPKSNQWKEVGRGERWAPAGRDAAHVVSVIPEAQYGANGQPTGYMYRTTFSDGRTEISDSKGVPSQFRTTDPNTVRGAAAAEASGTGEGKRAFGMSGIGDIITEARTILDGKVKPTASGLGTAVDASAAFFGQDVSGAAEADQLRAISGALVSKMPRMEGPQSDFDVENYKQMAGEVGNSGLPIARRKAALEVVEKLWKKYDAGSAPNMLPSQNMTPMGGPAGGASIDDLVNKYAQ